MLDRFEVFVCAPVCASIWFKKLLLNPTMTLAPFFFLVRKVTCVQTNVCLYATIEPKPNGESVPLFLLFF